MRHGARLCRKVFGARHLYGAPAQVAEEIKRFGAMQPHPQTISQVLSCTDSSQLLEFLKEDPARNSILIYNVLYPIQPTHLL